MQNKSDKILDVHKHNTAEVTEDILQSSAQCSANLINFPYNLEETASGTNSSWTKPENLFGILCCGETGNSDSDNAISGNVNCDTHNVIMNNDEYIEIIDIIIITGSGDADKSITNNAAHDVAQLQEDSTEVTNTQAVTYVSEIVGRQVPEENVSENDFLDSEDDSEEFGKKHESENNTWHVSESLSNLDDDSGDFKMERVPEFIDHRDFEQMFPDDKVHEDTSTDDQVLEDKSRPISNDEEQENKTVDEQLVLSSKLSKAMAFEEEQEYKTINEFLVLSTKLPTETCSNHAKMNTSRLSHSELDTMSNKERRTTIKNLSLHGDIVKYDCTTSSVLTKPNVEERAIAGDENSLTVYEQNINNISNPEQRLSDYENQTEITDENECLGDDSVNYDNVSSVFLIQRLESPNNEKERDTLSHVSSSSKPATFSSNIEQNSNITSNSELIMLSGFQQINTASDTESFSSKREQKNGMKYELKSQNLDNERHTIEAIPSNIEKEDDNFPRNSELRLLYVGKQKNAVNNDFRKTNSGEEELRMKKDIAENNAIINRAEKIFMVDNEAFLSVLKRTSHSQTEASKVEEKDTVNIVTLQLDPTQDENSSNFDLREQLSEEHENTEIYSTEQDDTIQLELTLQDLNVKERKQTTQDGLDGGKIRIEHEDVTIQAKNQPDDRFIVSSESAESSDTNLLHRSELEECKKIEIKRVDDTGDIHVQQDSFSRELTEAVLLNKVLSEFQSKETCEVNQVNNGENDIITDENEMDVNETVVECSHELPTEENVGITVRVEAEADFLIQIEYEGEEDQLGNLEFKFEGTDNTLEICNNRSISPIQIEREFLPHSPDLHITILKGIEKSGNICKRLLERSEIDNSANDESKQSLINSLISQKSSLEFCKKENNEVTGTNDKSEDNCSKIQNPEVQVVTYQSQIGTIEMTESAVKNVIQNSESNSSKFLLNTTEITMTADLQNDLSISNGTIISANNGSLNRMHAIQSQNETLEEEDSVQYIETDDSNDLCTPTNIGIKAELKNNRIMLTCKKDDKMSMLNEVLIETAIETQPIYDSHVIMAKSVKKSGQTCKRLIEKSEGDNSVNNESENIVLNGLSYSGESSSKFSKKNNTEGTWLNDKSEDNCSRIQNQEVKVVTKGDVNSKTIMTKSAVENVVIQNAAQHSKQCQNSEPNASNFYRNSTESTMSTDLQDDLLIFTEKIGSGNNEGVNGIEKIQLKNETLEEHDLEQIKNESVDAKSETNTVEYEETYGSNDLCIPMEVDFEAESRNNRKMSSCKKDDNNHVQNDISIETKIEVQPDQCKTVKIASLNSITNIQRDESGSGSVESSSVHNVSEINNEPGRNVWLNNSNNNSIAFGKRDDITGTCNTRLSCIDNTLDDGTEVIIPEIIYIVEKGCSNESSNNSTTNRNEKNVACASETSIETDKTRNERLSLIGEITATNVNIPEVTYVATVSDNIDSEEVQLQRHIVWDQDTRHPELVRQKMNSTKSLSQRSFGCRHCKKLFPSQPLLNSHSTMHGSMTKALQCVVCLSTFTDKKKMYVHASLAHQDQTIIFCDMCGKTFLLRTHIKHHISSYHKGVSGPKLYTIIKSKCPSKTDQSCAKNSPMPVKDPEVISMGNNHSDFLSWSSNKHYVGKNRRTLSRQFIDEKIGNVIYLPGNELLEEDNNTDSQIEDPLALEVTEQKHVDISAPIQFLGVLFDSGKGVRSNWNAKTYEINQRKDTMCYNVANSVIPCSNVNFNSPSIPFEYYLSKTVGTSMPALFVVPNENITNHWQTPMNDTPLSNLLSFAESGNQDNNRLQNLSEQQLCMAYNKDGHASYILRQNTPIIGDSYYSLAMKNSFNSEQHCQQQLTCSSLTQMPHVAQMTTFPWICALPLNIKDPHALSKNNQRLYETTEFANTRSEPHGPNPRNTASDLFEASIQNNTVAQVSSSSDDDEHIDMKPEVILVDDDVSNDMEKIKGTTEVVEESGALNDRRDKSDWKSITEMMTSILDQTTNLLNKVRVSTLTPNTFLEPEASLAKKRKADVTNEVSSSAAKNCRHECSDISFFNKTSIGESEINDNISDSWTDGTSQNLSNDRMVKVSRISTDVSNGKKSYDVQCTKRVIYVPQSLSKAKDHLGTNKTTNIATAFAVNAANATSRVEANSVMNKRTNEGFNTSEHEQCGKTTYTNAVQSQSTAEGIVKIRKNLENRESRITDDIEVEYVRTNCKKITAAALTEESSDIEIIDEFPTSDTSVPKFDSSVSSSYLCDNCGEKVCQSQGNKQYSLRCTSKSCNLESSEYLCDYCGKILSRSSDDEHLPCCAATSRNAASSDYLCHYCGEKVCRAWDTGHSLLCTENTRNSESSEYLCDHCGERIGCLQNIEQHSLGCTAKARSLESSEYLCDHCGCTVRQPQDVEQHLLHCAAKSGVDSQPCQESDQCQSDCYNSETQSYIVGDLVENTDSDDMEPDMDFDWYRSLNYIPQKMQRYKKDVIREIVSQEDVVAEFPEKFEQFLQRYLSMHRRTKKPFCFLCRSRTDNISELYTHFVLTHKHFYHSCSECELIFLESSSLMRHLFSHKYTYRRFPCHFCLKMHRSIYARDYHERKHENRTLFSCLFCHMDYYKEELFNAHMDAHEVASYHYVCSLCSLTYLTQLDLITHKSLNGCYPGIRQQVVTQMSRTPISNFRSSLRSLYRNKLFPNNR